MQRLFHSPLISLESQVGYAPRKEPVDGPPATPMPEELLPRFAWCCYAVFLLSAVVAVISGILLLWNGSRLDGQVLGITVFSAFFMTLLMGLLISGTRSMLGVIKDLKSG